MIYEKQVLKRKDGVPFTVRNAEPGDAEELRRFLRETAEETPFLSNEPEEATLSENDAQRLSVAFAKADDRLMLTAVSEGRLAAIGTLIPVRMKMRTKHRATVALIVGREFWNLGIGSGLLTILTGVAAEEGFTQVELEVCSANERARALYEKHGFQIYGTLDGAYRYRNGDSASSCLMVKYLLSE